MNKIDYNALLDIIKKFEKNEDFHFNKGIVYGNLGVAQSNQMKIDEGFSNILKALIEDSQYLTNNKPEYDFFNRDLFIQFEDAYVIKKLQNIISNINITKINTTEQLVISFITSLNNDQRVFFDYTFARIIQNLESWKDKENSFSANRLLAYTQDLCLFNEDILKCRFTPSELSTKLYWTLSNLIEKKFSGVNIQGCSVNTMNDLSNCLNTELSKQVQPEKCLRTLLILRNFSSHNISSGTSKDCFYMRYEEILAEIIQAMFHIYFISVPP